ncbi:hypothetical protein KAR91_40835 [Candidatus Pacearchaeota archaeon]|nr:hypothetical protein [Candidatus Pacearchaeota archaeon]
MKKVFEKIAITLMTLSVIAAASAVVSVKVQENDIEWLKESMKRIEIKLDKVIDG